MAKSKKVQMPAGIRNKLMAAVAMLLVSSIMMVSSTYAWFTLSTAPEVTGITTSVGANGNLEIALLNTATFGDAGKGMSSIGSAVGDSSAVKDVTLANITWGNLVDLSHSSYGLNLVALNPAAPNYADDTLKTIISPTAPLETAEYGSDGRVKGLADNTVSGIYNSDTAKWVVKEILTGSDVATQTYGVRAIGVDSNMSTAQIVLNAAQVAVATGKTGAATGVSAAVNANKDTFVSLLNKDETASYTDKELTALGEVAAGIQSSLNAIVKTYANAVLATLSSSSSPVTIEEEVLVVLRGQLSGETSATNVIAVMTDAGITSYPYSDRLATLATAQSDVAAVITYLGTCDTNTAPANIKNYVVKPLIGGSDTMYAVNENMLEVDLDPSNIAEITAIYVGGGLLGTIAEDAGTYRLTTYLGYPVYASQVTAEDKTPDDDDATKTVTPVETGNLATVALAVSKLTAAGNTTGEQTIVDFYGYIIDFAFRTNAASSYLQLQTAAANRVYTDGSAGTMGGGSTVTFDYSDASGAAALSAEQAETLLGAVKLVFLNTVDGTIYATAKLSNIQIAETGNIATAEVVLDETYAGDEATDTSIVALAQNQPTAVSVLVYLDGNTVDNSDVAVGASSGILNLNLQFSSSAELVPMENSALKNMTESEGYTVTFNANGGEGTMAAVTGQSGTYTLPTTCDFTRTGYTFQGWGLSAKATSYVTSVDKAATVYAIWKANTTSGDDTQTTTYSVTFNANNGDSTQVTTKDVSTVDEITATTLTRTGYTFKGWSTNSSATEADASFTLSDGLVLYAVWEADTYAVTINGTDATDATYGQDYTFTATATPTVSVNGTSVTATGSGNGTYTIAGTDVTGDIIIEFTT